MHTPVQLSQFKGSQALLCSEADKAAIFVHGFGGSSTGTWPYFSVIVDWPEFAEAWSRTDIFLYDYRSASYDLLDHAFLFKKFLLTAFPRPDWEKLSPAPYRDGREYRNLTLVGHSTGAIVIRKALWLIRDELVNEDEINEYSHIGTSPFFNSRLRLFAPALLGTQFSGWKGLLLKVPYVETLFRAFAYKSRVLQTLEVNRKPLEILQRQTEEKANKYLGLTGFRAHVLFGQYEEVVAKEAYTTDYLDEPIAGATHTSICKPTKNFLKPMEFVSYEARGAGR